MKLRQKINHIKRHRVNRRVAKSADTVYSSAIKCFGKINITFIVSLRLYDILYFRKDSMPKNITSSWLMPDSTVMTMVEPDIPMKTVHDICIPIGVDIPFTPGSERIMNLSAKPIPPQPTAILDI